jgi:hypothetical protein
MKIIRSHPVRIAALACVAWIAATGAQAAQIVTNWAAFNDHRPGPLPTPTRWGTAIGVTPYDMRVGPGGTLTNFLNNQEIPGVTLTVTANGAADDFGQTGPPYPINSGTPAYNLFFGIVDVGNTNSVIGVHTTGGITVTLMFSGLNPAKHYVFRGTSARGGSYPLRWTVATIQGAQTFVDAHINGAGTDPNRVVLTSNNVPADLGPGQAAYNSGDNRPGAVVGWDFITPAPDGSFSVVSSQYAGPIPGGGVGDITRYGYAISAMLLAEVEVAPPGIATQPAAQTTVEQNRPLTLSVGATGTPLLYQWYKQGVGPIAGATFPTYSVSQAALADSGNYFVVVYNPLNSVTSSIAHVTVNADVTPPSIASAYSYPSFDRTTQVATLDQVVVEFNEPVDPVTAADMSRYILSGGATVNSAVLSNETSVVLGLSTPLAEDTSYTVRANGVLDKVNNNINNGGTNNPAPFRTWTQGPANGLLFEVYDTGPGVEVALLKNSPVFPDSPSTRLQLWAFDTRVVYPDNSHDAYGSRVSGVFIPPVSGDWIFYLRSDDRSELYLNPNGLDPAGKQIIAAEVTGADGDWNKIISSPLHLRGGQGYYIEGLQKEDSGTDYIKVAARLASAGLPTLGVPNTEVDSNALSGPIIAFNLAPRDLGGTLTIVQDVADITIDENNPATFSVQVSNPSQLPLQYQWFRNGSPITGANGRTYEIEPTIAADNGAMFSVQVAKVGSVVTSRAARLTVRPDTHGPLVIEVFSSYTNLTRVTVRFNELINTDDAGDPFTFDPDGELGATLSTLRSDGRTVDVDLAGPLTLNGTYHVKLTNLRDLSGNVVNPNPTVIAFVAGGSDLPRLTITTSPDYADISWPAPSTGFVLEETSQLMNPASSTVWTPVTEAPTVINGRNTVNVFTPGANKFYRLRQPPTP